MYNITGTLRLKNAEQQVSDKFRKRDFVLTDNSSQYPQYISFQLVQDKCSLIEPFNPGDEIRVFFNLRGREWKAPTGEIKYFNTVEAWKIEGVNQQQASPAAGNGTAMAASDVSSFSSGGGSAEEDDLPF